MQFCARIAPIAREATRDVHGICRGGREPPSRVRCLFMFRVATCRVMTTQGRTFAAHLTHSYTE